jgi:hypothetical protein
MFYMCIFLSILLFYKLMGFREWQYNLYKKEFDEAYANGMSEPHFYDIWISFACAAIYNFLSHPFKKLVWPFLYDRCKERNDDLTRIFKTEKGAKASFLSAQLTLSLIYGLLVLGKSDYLPWSLGGKWDNKLEYIWKDFPIVNEPGFGEQMKTYYLVSLGYHLHSTYTLLSENQESPRADLMEMLLHHSCTFMLYFVSYLCNLTKIGSIVMFLHDWADWSLKMTKAFGETNIW